MNIYRQSSFGFCMPGYRWCGPRCSGPGAPTNEVDACCKLHDECYQRYGRTAYCDQLFQNCLIPKINYHTQIGRDAALFYRIMKWRNFFF